jgi:hypothetical protein
MEWARICENSLPGFTVHYLFRIMWSLGCASVVLWEINNLPEELPASKVKVEDGGYMFLRNVGVHFEATRCLNHEECNLNSHHL